MKKCLSFFGNKIDYLIPLVFLVICYAVLYQQFAIIPLLLILSILSIRSGLSVFTKKLAYGKIGLLFLLGLLIYFSLLNLIGSIELWGDEVGVLFISEHTLGEISDMVSRSHAGVPPLDYWIMRVWTSASRFFGMSPNVYFRIPYMVYHIMASVLFASIFFSNKKIQTTEALRKIPVNLLDDALYGITCFLVYFFNPLLFAFSLEVRFYALQSLGIVITLLLFHNSAIRWVRYLPLLLLFGLNSIFHFMIVIPILLMELIKEQTRFQRKQLIYLLIIFGVFVLMIIPRLYVPVLASQRETYQQIVRALQQLVVLPFGNWYQMIFLLFILVGVFLKRNEKSIQILLLVIGGIIFTSFIAYVKNYFVFNVRHYLFIIPLIIYLIFKFIEDVHTHKRLLYALVFAIFLVPWTTQSIQMLLTGQFFTKYGTGAEKIFQIAQNKNANVVIFPNNRNIYSVPVSFYGSTFVWYQKYYDKVSLQFPQSAEESCLTLKQKQNTVLVVLFNTRKDPCGSGSIKRSIHEFTIYSNH